MDCPQRESTSNTSAQAHADPPRIAHGASAERQAAGQPKRLLSHPATFLPRLHASHATQPETPSSGISASGAGGRTSDSDELNRIHLTGRLGSEPLLHDVGDDPVARLSLASTEHWLAADGTPQRRTAWYNLTGWEALAEQCGRQLHRGDYVYVDGRLHLWSENHNAQQMLCHTIVLGRIILLAAGGKASSDDAELAEEPTKFARQVVS